MKRKIQIGTILYENEDTTAIYEHYKEYFAVHNENDWFIKYIISKEPSQELTIAIEAYYATVKERNRKRDEFVDTVANEVFAGLTQEDKEYIFLHPDSTTHHFDLGLSIRNMYIHGKELEFQYYSPDDLSSEIIAKIASLIIENYDYENPFYRRLYGSFSFNHLRRLYYAINGKYPDELMAKYEDMPDDWKAAEIVEKKIKSGILDTRRFKQLSLKYGLTEVQYCEYKSFVDKYNRETWAIVPYDIALLTSKMLEPALRQKLLLLLKTVLEKTHRISLELPAFVFNQKDAVLLAVGAMGKSLKRFPMFNSDDEVIHEALSENGEAIQYVKKELRGNREYIVLALDNEYSNALKMRCMIPYRDNEELVKIALKANGCNIRYASDRLRDDFETAKYAVCHQKNWYPNSTICNLSPRLRDNLEIALLDIREGNVSVDQYSRRLRDSDEVAEALIASDNKWRLYQMSKRIQKKYDDED